MSITIEEAEQWLRNLDRAKDIGRCWDTEEEWKELIEELRPSAVVYPWTKPVEPSSAKTVKTDDAFQEGLCKCRLWNKGYAKQCSYASKVDGVCTFHSKKIDEFGGWAFGFYDEEIPSHYLYNHGKKKKGMTLNWRTPSKPKTSSVSEVAALKNEYKELKGVGPKGPKANDRDWLLKKIKEAKDELLAVVELNELKDEYEELLGKRPMGPKANDIEWLKEKIIVFNEGWPSSEEEDEEDSESEDSESEDKEDNGKGTGIQAEDRCYPCSDQSFDVKEVKPDEHYGGVVFEFEGVEYYREKEKDGAYMNVYKNGAIVGQWCEGYLGDEDEGWINWESSDFQEIHMRDENYDGEF